MSDTQGATPRRTAPRWLWVLLILSLAANLAVAGAVAGRFLRGDRDDAELGRYNSHLVRMLPESRRPMAREILLAARGDRAAGADSLREATVRMHDAMTAEPFDPAALSAALDARMALFGGRFERRNAALVEIVSKLDPAERRAFADALRERAERWAGRMNR